jgi:hypothetical protein
MATAAANQKVKLENVDYSKLWWLTLVAGVVSAVINVVIYFAAQSLGFVGDLVPSFMAASPTPFAPAIAISSILFTIIGGVALWAIDRFSARPITTWRIVAVVALVLSFGQPFFAFSNTNEIILLELMHLVAGIVAIGIIGTQVKKA